MQAQQQEQLFGAPARQLERITLTVTIPDEHRDGWVILLARPLNRNVDIQMYVTVKREQSMSHVLGVVNRLLHAYWMHPKAYRGNMLSVANRLGKDGYQVSLK